MSWMHHPGNLSSNRTCLLHGVQVSHLQSSLSLAHLSSGELVGSTLSWCACQRLYGPSGYDRLPLCQCWHDGLQWFQDKWELIAAGMKPFPTGYIRQVSFPTHISFKKVVSESDTKNIKRFLLSLDGHITYFYRKKGSVSSLSRCQSSCRFIPHGVEQLSGPCMCFTAVASSVTTKNNTGGR